MGKDYVREVQIICPTCGGSLFSSKQHIVNDYVEVKCSNCGRIISKDDLIDENQENIEAHIKELGQEAIKDLLKNFKWR